MGLFTKFRENGGDGGSEVVREEQSSSGEAEAVSLIEMLEHSVQNVKDAVFGSGGEEAVGALPRALAMEDPFSQSDHVLAGVVEHDVRSASGGSEERKTIVQTVRESLTQSAHVVRDAVLGHTTADQQANGGGGQFAHAVTPIEDDVAPEEQRRSIIETVGDIMAHPVQTVKDIVGSRSDVVEATDGESSAGGGAEQASSGVYDLGNPVERGDEEEVKGLIQTVKEAAQEVKEEMMEVVHEVKDVVMSNDTLPNVQTESITEDAGERPSMELVHTIVHD